ncbi:MAG TPA: efflux RND transporter periplasmic adaptor subunit [Terriglobia bacterium]|nr:efflux RND transporter periplasmic adaptor subunit [Terriglobia bacterium]
MALRNYYQHHRKLVNLSAIALAAVLTLGMVMRARSGEIKYLTATVKRGDITAIVQATGTINPLTTVPVGSYVSGTVQYIFADFNSRVRAGQVLAQLDPSIYEAQAIEARGNLGNAEANLKNLEASIGGVEAAIQTDQANIARLKAAADYARSNARRIANLAKEGVLSEDQKDLTQSNLEQADAQVRAEEATLNQARAQLEQTRAQVQQARAVVQTNKGALDQAETNLRYTTILSPIDGTIVARNVTVGQSVAAALQAPVVFSIAQDLTRMQVYAATDESDTGNIKIGTEASFQVDAFPADVFHGQVSAIRLNATMVQNVVTYNTIIDFENPQEKLLPGETAYVTIPVGRASNAISIPNAALRFTPELPRKELQGLYDRFHIPAAAATSHLGGWQVVWKQGSDKKLIPLAVRVGITDYSFTELKQGPVNVDDVLITGEEDAGGSQQQPGQLSGGPRFGGPRR